MNRDIIFKITNQSRVYSVVYGVILLISIIPLMFKERTEFYYILELVAVIFFIIDYIARFICSDYILKKGYKSFIIYPFTLFAIIDLVSIIPFFLETYTVLFPIRFIRLLKLMRVFKILRYNKEITILVEVFKRDWKILKALFMFCIVYIFTMALIVFQVEPQTFDTFFDALYWSCVSLTTVGYGDIYAITNFGKTISMISSLVGVGIIALPSGIIAGTFVQVFKEHDDNKNNSNN